MLNYSQKLIDVWEQRPRRQLDYSLLTQESIEDMEWTGRILQALIPSMREIRERFGLEPTPPIVIQMPANTTYPRAQLASPAAGSPTDGSRQPLNAPGASQSVSDVPTTPPTQPPAPGDANPSKLGEKRQGKGKSSGTRAKAPKPARTAAKTGHKPGSASKSASADAKPDAAPLSAPTAPAASAPPPATAGADMSDPPAPTLGPIGE